MRQRHTDYKDTVIKLEHNNSAQLPLKCIGRRRCSVVTKTLNALQCNHNIPTTNAVKIQQS